MNIAINIQICNLILLHKIETLIMIWWEIVRIVWMGYENIFGFKWLENFNDQFVLCKFSSFFDKNVLILGSICLWFKNIRKRLANVNSCYALVGRKLDLLHTRFVLPKYLIWCNFFCTPFAILCYILNLQPDFIALAH